MIQVAHFRYSKPALATIVACFILFHPISIAHASVDLDNGLVAYWEMNETSGTIARDATGNGNTAEVVGPVNWVSGKFGNAFNFFGDGIVSYMGIPSSSHIPIGNSYYTISAWMKSDGSGATQGIVGWGNYGFTDQVTAFRLDNGSNCLNGDGLNTYWWDDDIIGCAPGDVDIYDGDWHHVLTRFDGTERTMFIDDQLIYTDTPTGTHAVPDTSNFAIGLTAPFFDEYFNGSLDDLRIYNRALSDDEITALYDGEGIGTFPPPSDNAATPISGNGPMFMGSASALPGYISPRPQIIYPDGTIMYVEEEKSSQLQLVDAYRQLLSLLEELLRQLEMQRQDMHSRLSVDGHS